ncbi:hypothetical protein phiAS5_ORF0307 [Aeromonas phage phiAS5]|uniref:Uncharacterized protein n=1 Tax=Aeromonas phage phiAS5 TaxID=879630 RepID=E1A261_9CAUD|nr:hypothetical protein phiAS5_ORF0307 [Aeromonas phage phiAS5]ADM80150.1 hypothetical protein phiAS5_ORF0307 [Aeromonas phage phiAS5]BES53089.1 hypothetical protein [Aeromonas phage phiWae14]
MEMLDMCRCYVEVARYAINMQRSKKIDHWSFDPVEYLKQHRTIHLDFGRGTMKTRAAFDIAQDHNGVLVTINQAHARWIQREVFGNTKGKTRITFSKGAVAEIRENSYDVVVIDEPALHKPHLLEAIYDACIDKKIQNIILIGR